MGRLGRALLFYKDLLLLLPSAANQTPLSCTFLAWKRSTFGRGNGAAEASLREGAKVVDTVRLLLGGPPGCDEEANRPPVMAME